MPQRSFAGMLVALLVLVVTFLVYSQAIGFGFVNWDDDVYLFENARLHSARMQDVAWFLTNPYYHAYIPLTMLSHMFDIQVWGVTPAGHHLGNIVLHALNTVLLLILGIRLFDVRNGLAVRSIRELLGAAVPTAALLSFAAAALLFALHPMRAESVAWVSDRKDLLCAFFLLLSALSYVNATSAPGTARGRRSYAASLVLFLFASLSKTVAIVLPAVLLVLDVSLLKRRERGDTARDMFADKLPFLIISAVLGVIAALVSPASGSSDMFDVLSPLQRVLLPIYNVMFYIGKTLLPMNFSPMYPLAAEGEMLLALLAFTAVTLLCVRLWKRGNRFPLTAWVCYVILILPSAGAASVIMQTTADRYSYLPSMALFLFVGGCIAAIEAAVRLHTINGVAFRTVVVLLAVFFGYLSVRQQRFWSNSETLWGRAIDVHPSLPLPHNNMGLALQARGAVGEAELAFQRALKLKPDYVEAHVNLANILLAKGDWDEAERSLERAAEIDPTRAEVYNNLGVVANARGRTLDALAWFRRCVAVNPDYAQGHYNLGALYEKMGNREASVEALQHAARLGHRDAQESLKSKGVAW